MALADSGIAVENGTILPECCLLSEQLQQTIMALKDDSVQMFTMEEEYNRLHETFVELHGEVCLQLSLLQAGTQAGEEQGALIDGFLQCVATLWNENEQSLAKEMKGMHLRSRKYGDIPLGFILTKAHKSLCGITTSFKTLNAHKICQKTAENLCIKLSELLHRLSSGDITYRFLFYLTRAIPQLEELKNKANAVLTNHCNVKVGDCDSTLPTCSLIMTRPSSDVARYRCKPRQLVDMFAETNQRGKRKMDDDNGTKLIGILEDKLLPIVIPQLDAELFKPLLD